MAMGLLGLKVGMTQVYDAAGKMWPVTVLKIGPCPVLQVREPERDGYHGVPASHGVKKHHRSPGSVGSHASNRGSGRPKKGKKMAGRYGAERVTVRNLKVVRIDADQHLLLVHGAVPGPNGSLVMVRPTN